MEIVMAIPELYDELINEIARETAEATLTDYTEDECEAALDEMFAEHQALMYAAQSWDNDAVAYGQM